MISYTKGNLLEAEAEALVNTVNTVGVMGKGIALQFKKAFPHNFKVYVSACKDKSFRTGQMLVVEEVAMYGNKYIVNFPTKEHWRGKSKYTYIETGLKALHEVIVEKQIKSIAIPPLGCGNGGLHWPKVKALIEQYLDDLQGVEIVVYEPSAAVKELLKAEEKVSVVKLTPARAMLLYAMFYYETLGEGSNLFVANKLAWFFQRLGVSDFARLSFKAHHYGPYSEQVVHVLHDLNGAWLSGLEQMNAKPFETLTLDYNKMDEVSTYVRQNLENEKLNKLKDLIRLIKGYQSPLSLEVLASVDFVLKENPSANLEDVTLHIRKWSKRKGELFKPEYIKIAYDHLKVYGRSLVVL